MFERSRKGEHALLIQPHAGGRPDDGLTEEFSDLARSAGASIAALLTARIDRPNPSTLIGSGKLEEVKAAADATGADLVLVNFPLSPGQERNLEKFLQRRVLDRTGLILDIFAQRARSHEGKLQVELAQLRHMATRLVRGWTHLERQRGGSIGLRGPGETQIEIDRRRARDRMIALKRELGEIHNHRERYRSRRRDRPIPVISIVGYTNAGKSTLLNALTNADAFAEDKLFATLDPTTRRIRLPGGREALLTDTVGFINNLPTTLVAAFRSTLEEINEADIILHVLDITHGNAAEQAQTTRQVLEELGAATKPTLTALNKIDLLDADALPADLVADLELTPDYVPISAERRIGLDVLLKRIEEMLEHELVNVTVTIPYARAELVNVFHSEGQVEATDFSEAGTIISGQLPPRLLERFRPFISAKEPGDAPELAAAAELASRTAVAS